MNLEFLAPAMVRLDIGAARAGTGARDGDRSQGITTRNLNAITPETVRTSHYFWAQAQDFGLDDPTITDVDFQLVHGAFLEDLAIIRGQQENIDLAPNAQANHPYDDHLLPLFVALGAAGQDEPVERLHTSFEYGVLAMDTYRFGAA